MDNADINQRLAGSILGVAANTPVPTETPKQIAERLRWQQRYLRREYVQFAIQLGLPYDDVHDLIEAANQIAEYIEGVPHDWKAELVEAFETTPKLDGMSMYVGSKAIYARPMTRGDYCAYRQLDVLPNEDPNDRGFIVQYSDGYISWSPETQFNAAYSRV